MQKFCKFTYVSGSSASLIELEFTAYVTKDADANNNKYYPIILAQICIYVLRKRVLLSRGIQIR